MSHQHLRAQITRWVDDHFPGFIECRFTDRHGREWVIIDKVPVFGDIDASLDARSNYPQPATIACEVVSRGHDNAGRAIVTIDTMRPWAIETEDGATRFEVFADQLTASSENR